MAQVTTTLTPAAFVIWCLRFGIFLTYKTFLFKYVRIYFDVTLIFTDLQTCAFNL